MSEQRSALEKLISSLQQERDELKVQIHLAGMEAKDEYDRLSRKFDELTDQYEPFKSAVAQSGENVIAALMLAADEMKSGFHRIRKAITDS